MNRLAPVLAVVAVLAVLASTVAAVAAYQGRPSTPDPADPVPAASGSATTAPTPTQPDVVTATPYGAFDDEQVIAGGVADNAMFEVPAVAQGWTRESAGYSLYYGDPGGDGPFAGVNGPAILDDGWCTDAEEGDISNRGFVGLTRSAEGDDVRTANTTLAAEWVDAISLDTETGEVAASTPLETRDYPLADGAVAVRSDAVVDAFDFPCAPPRIAFTIVSLDTGDAIANLVMVRDVGSADALSARTAERILQTLQAQVPPA